MPEEYAFLVDTDDGETEWRTRGGDLDPETAVERCYDRHPDGEIVRTLQGDIPDGVDLSPPDDNPNVADEGNLDLPEDDAESGDLPFDPSSNTVSDIEDRVSEIEDPEALRAVRSLEADDKNRTTAIEAIEERLDQVNDG